MTEPVPTFIPRQLSFFSDWYVEIRWPNGAKQRVDGFDSEAHARGWITHESASWLANSRRPGS